MKANEPKPIRGKIHKKIKAFHTFFFLESDPMVMHGSFCQYAGVIQKDRCFNAPCSPIKVI